MKQILTGEELLKILEITDRPVTWIRPGAKNEKLDVARAIPILRASLYMYEGKASSRRVYWLKDMSPAPPPEEKPKATSTSIFWSFRAHESPVLQPAIEWFERMGYNRQRYETC